MSGPNLHLEDGRPGVFWVYDALIDSKQKYHAKGVYVVLARLARTGKRLQYTHAEIAKLAGFSTSSVRRGLDDLEKAGWLEIIPSLIPGSDLKGPNTYKLLCPIVLVEQSSAQGEQPDRSGGAVDRSGRAINTEEKPKREELQHQEVKNPLGFSEFWLAYPKKKAKRDAEAAWQKLTKEDKLPTLQVLLQALEAQKRSVDWTKDGGQYIPYPATWLNSGRWEDDVSAPAPATGRPSFTPADYAGRKTGDYKR